MLYVILNSFYFIVLSIVKSQDHLLKLETSLFISAFLTVFVLLMYVASTGKFFLMGFTKSFAQGVHGRV